MFIRTSLQMKYIATYLFLAASMLILIKYYGCSEIENALLRDKETSLYKEANLIAQNYEIDIDSITSSHSESAPPLRQRFESLQIMSDIRFWLVDRSGEIIIDSSKNSNQERTHITKYSQTFLDKQTYIGKLPSKLLNEEILAVIYPLAIEQTTKGYLVLMSPTAPLHQKAVDYIDVISFCFLLFFAILLLVFLHLAHHTIHPVKLITKAVREYSDGHFDYPMKDLSTKEYDELTAAIEYLSTKLQNTNDYQKKFIANVSHDFRSPLTSIKGYTEAMLDGTIPPEMQEKYLNIILFETERLSKLTGSLLELSQFENNGILLEPSTFDINHIIKITSSAFEKQCLEKRISIQLIFSQKSLLVEADVNRIEQVIQNLIDNAIKFSQNDSTIEIQTVEQSGKAFISIKDHGIGIPKKSLPYIWNRFYKSDLSRGKDKTGTGLGLSITKEILEAHNEHINVVSTEGVGTVFTFTLKVHTA